MSRSWNEEEIKKVSEVMKKQGHLSYEEFIQELVKHYDEIDTSDLQGIVMVRCIKTGEDEDEILDEIYKRIK